MNKISIAAKEIVKEHLALLDKSTAEKNEMLDRLTGKLAVELKPRDLKEAVDRIYGEPLPADYFDGPKLDVSLFKLPVVDMEAWLKSRPTMAQIQERIARGDHSGIAEMSLRDIGEE